MSNQNVTIKFIENVMFVTSFSKFLPVKVFRGHLKLSSANFAKKKRLDVCCG